MLKAASSRKGLSLSAAILASILGIAGNRLIGLRFDGEVGGFPGFGIKAVCVSCHAAEDQMAERSRQGTGLQPGPEAEATMVGRLAQSGLLSFFGRSEKHSPSNGASPDTPGGQYLDTSTGHAIDSVPQESRAGQACLGGLEHRAVALLVGKHWREQKEKSPDQVTEPLRVVLLGSMLDAILNGVKQLETDPALRETAEKRGLVVNGSFPFLQWGPEKKEYQAASQPPLSFKEVQESLVSLADSPFIRFIGWLSTQTRPVLLWSTMAWQSITASWPHPGRQRDTSEFLQFLQPSFERERLADGSPGFR